MMHYSCDICGQKLNEKRFVARLEVFVPFDQEGASAVSFDEDADHLEEVAGILNDFDLTGELELDVNRSRSFRYDLCPDCQKQYVKDPLALHKPRRMRISDN